MELKCAMAHLPSEVAWSGWGTRASLSVTAAETWTGKPMAAERRLEALIHRYLAAFGPASVPDMQVWSGLTRLREVVDGLRPTLRVYHDEQGRELFDLPDAVHTESDTPAPVRFLPAFDNLVLGHADRTRIISDENRKRVAPGQAWVTPTFLVDGFVRGSWSLRGSTLFITAFSPLPEADTTAVLDEAEHLLPFITNGADDATVTFS